MKKRYAMTIAAGLVAALLIGTIALSLGLAGTRTADAAADSGPRVRTIHRTVTIEREAKAQPPETVTVVTAGASSPASTEGSEDASEQEGSFEPEGTSEHEGEDDD